MMIKSGWKLMRLGEFGQCMTGLTYAPDNVVEGGGLLVLRSSNVQAGKIALGDNVYVNIDVSDDKLTRRGDILVCVRNGSRDLIGKNALIEHAGSRVAFGAFMMLFRASESRFVYQLMQTHGYWQQISENLGATINSINGRDFVQFKFLVPESKEVRVKIADILGTWDEALEKLDALIAAKERRQRALLLTLIAGPHGPLNAKGWKEVRLSQVLSRVFRPVEIADAEQLALVSIRRRCGGLFRRPDILASEYKTQDLHALKSGDFLISKRQVVHGAWALVESEFDGTLVSKEYAIMVNQAPERLDMRYFAWLAQTPRMLRLARVASTGVHIEKLIFDPDVFLREKISLPTLIEQRAIAAVLDAADAELRLLHQQRTALNQQKRGLMQQLLTGKVRVSA